MVAYTILISGVLAIIFGIIILIWPRALNMAVALYLIIVGILQLIGGSITGAVIFPAIALFSPKK